MVDFKAAFSEGRSNPRFLGESSKDPPRPGQSDFLEPLNLLSETDPVMAQGGPGLNHLLSRIGLVGAVIGLSGAAYMYLEVQVLKSYPFHGGVFGNAYLLPDLTYTTALELFAILAAAGLFTRSYAGVGGTNMARVINAIGTMLLTLGIPVAAIVYAEIHLVWGEVLPGVHLWQGFPGGGGYPWGFERVAYNLCLAPVGGTDNCYFLNYDELFWIAIMSAVAGYIMRNWHPNSMVDSEMDALKAVRHVTVRLCSQE